MYVIIVSNFFCDLDFSVNDTNYNIMWISVRSIG